MKTKRPSAGLSPGLTSAKLEGKMPSETLATEFGRMINASDNLGKILKLRRLMAGLTLNELSTMSGLSESHLCRVEKGERFPAPQTLIKLAKCLGFEELEYFKLIGLWLADTPSGLSSNKI